MRKKLPPSRLLIIFEAVVRCGGISRAAADLNMTQPSVTQAIKQLEAWVGVLLMDRSRRPTHPTRAGWLLHESIQTGFNGIIAAIDEIGWLKDTRSCPLTIEAPIGFATYWLMPHLASFNERYPLNPVNVLSTYESAPLLGSRTAIAIRFGNSSQIGVQSDLLFRERIRPVCSPILAHDIQQKNMPFESVSLIHVEYNDDRWTSWDEYLQMIGWPKRGSCNGLFFTNYIQATQATLDGRGLMLGWDSVVHRMLPEKKLVPLFGEELIARDSFFLLRKFGTRPAAVDLLAEWLLDKGKEMEGYSSAKGSHATIALSRNFSR